MMWSWNAIRHCVPAVRAWGGARAAVGTGQRGCGATTAHSRAATTEVRNKEVGIIVYEMLAGLVMYSLFSPRMQFPVHAPLILVITGVVLYGPSYGLLVMMPSYRPGKGTETD